MIYGFMGLTSTFAFTPTEIDDDDAGDEMAAVTQGGAAQAINLFVWLAVISIQCKCFGNLLS